MSKGHTCAFPLVVCTYTGFSVMTLGSGTGRRTTNGTDEPHTAYLVVSKGSFFRAGLPLESTFIRLVLQVRSN